MATWLEATRSNGKRVLTRISGEGALRQIIEDPGHTGLLTDDGECYVKESYEQLCDVMVALGERLGGADPGTEQRPESEPESDKDVPTTLGELAMDWADQAAARNAGIRPLR